MVTRLHKKKSNLDKENHRPDNFLPVFRKIYERAINEQINSFLVNISMLKVKYHVFSFIFAIFFYVSDFMYLLRTQLLIIHDNTCMHVL